jgi:hypothetical protein
MKTVKKYLSGCTWCSAKGFVPIKDYGMGTTPLTETCPVCNGAKTIIVTEESDDFSDRVYTPTDVEAFTEEAKIYYVPRFTNE